MESNSNPKVWQWLPKLIPFFASSILYISVLSANNTPSISLALFKCLPIFSLIYFVSSSKKAAESNLKKRELESNYRSSFISRIRRGLAAGAIGDACLVFPEWFVVGMVAFAIQHVFYLAAYKFRPLKLGLGIVIYAVAFILFLFVQDKVPDPVISNAMPFYAGFLVTMFWRSVARMNATFFRRVGAIGGLLFVISDFFLVLNFQGQIQDGEIFVITTYYLSQLGTSLTVLDPDVDG